MEIAERFWTFAKKDEICTSLVIDFPLLELMEGDGSITANAPSLPHQKPWTIELLIPTLASVKGQMPYDFGN